MHVGLQAIFLESADSGGRVELVSRQVGHTGNTQVRFWAALFIIFTYLKKPTSILHRFVRILYLFCEEQYWFVGCNLKVSYRCYVYSVD